MIKSFYPNSSCDISELFSAIAMWKFPVILPRKVFSLELMHNFHSNEYAAASDAVSGFSPNGTLSLASLSATVDETT